MAERIVNFSDPADKAKVLSYVRNLAGKYRVKIVKERKRRSDAQNRFMWGVVIPYVAAGLQEAWGETLSSDETHEYLKQKFLAKPVVNHHTGETMGNTIPHSSILNTTEFIAYIEQVSKFAAESLGVVIPSPGEEVYEEPKVRRVAVPSTK